MHEKKFLLKFISALLFVYVCLFEFILDANKILPKPSLLLESFISAWKDYDLLFSLIVTVSVIYISIIAAYGIVYLLKNILARVYYSYHSILYASKVFKYFPAFFYAVLFEFWFRGSYYAEFLFAILAVLALMISAYFEKIKEVREDQLLFTRSLKLSDKTVFSKVVWNFTRPGLLINLKRINFYLWVLILLFEFIANVEGLGKVYNQMLAFRDFSGIFVIAIIIALIILITNKAIGFIYTKLIHWKNELRLI